MPCQGIPAILTLMTMIIIIIYLVIDINLISKCEPAKEHIKAKKFWIPTTFAILAGLYLAFGQSAMNTLKAKAQAVQQQNAAGYH